MESGSRASRSTEARHLGQGTTPWPTSCSRPRRPSSWPNRSLSCFAGRRPHVVLQCHHHGNRAQNLDLLSTALPASQVVTRPRPSCVATMGPMPGILDQGPLTASGGAHPRLPGRSHGSTTSNLGTSLLRRWSKAGGPAVPPPWDDVAPFCNLAPWTMAQNSALDDHVLQNSASRFWKVGPECTVFGISSSNITV